tara:strand:- start:202 stop:633 length:432 start_codon:yes stop_codon:yes gene_type:complete
LEIKKIILTVTLLASLNIWSEYTEVIKEDSRTLYIDFNDQGNMNGYVYYWTLTNHDKPWKEGLRSYRELHQVDCTSPPKSRIVYTMYYKQPMGEGKNSYMKNDPTDWKEYEELHPYGTLNDAICESPWVYGPLELHPSIRLKD